MTGKLPIIDIAALFGTSPARAEVAREIKAACRDTGFFYISGHGVSADVVARLDHASRKFFALPNSEKMKIAMAKAGRAWRGFFPVHGELTSGKPDLKEGVYFGIELPQTDARVKAGVPMHGQNLWPDAVPELKPAVLDFMSKTTEAAHAVMRGVALSLDLDENYFAKTYTEDPTVLFRVFHYPPARASAAQEWGVGEHTDYGLLTLLAQDDCGGLQVKGTKGWIEAPPIKDTLVCNIGDMLDLLTGGWYRSTPHRVRNVSGRDRLSFPLFFDPAFAAKIEPLPDRANATDDSADRWDKSNVHHFRGTYGDYLLGKVGKVFPDLQRQVL